ncbi:hypothetical protein V8C86DRAFT_3194735 [Haematococcus lacustris]
MLWEQPRLPSPSLPPSPGEDENEGECVASACRVFQLSLTASSLALDLQRLELACAFLLTDRLWAVAMADLAQLAVGLHADTAQRRLLMFPSALSSPHPASLSPTAAGPTAMGGQQGPGWVEKLEPFWQLFVTYVVEATAGTEHNLAWWMAAVKAGNAYLPDLVTPLQRAELMNAKMLVRAAAQYVQEVRQQGEGGWEVLLAMAGRMRKRFRSTAAKINNSRVVAVVSSLMQALGAAGEARCLRLHQQLGAACNVTSQGNGVTPAEQVSLEQAGGASVVPSSPEPGTAASGAAAGAAAGSAAGAAAGSVTAAGAGGQGLDPVAPHLAAAGQARLRGPGAEALQCLKQMLAVVVGCQAAGVLSLCSGEGLAACQRAMMTMWQTISYDCIAHCPHTDIAAAAAAQPQQASEVAKACEAVLTKVNALLGTPSNTPAATQQQTSHGQTRAHAAAAAAAQKSRKGSEALDTSRE